MTIVKKEYSTQQGVSARLADLEANEETLDTAATAGQAGDLSWGQALEAALGQKVDRDELVVAVTAAFAAGQGEIVQLVAILADKLDQALGTVTAVNVLADKIDALKAAVVAGFDKVDTNHGVATDYAATVSALLM